MLFDHFVKCFFFMHTFKELGHFPLLGVGEKHCLKYSIIICSKARENTCWKVKIPDLHNFFDLFQSHGDFVDGHMFLRLYIKPQKINSLKVPRFDNIISLLIWKVQSQEICFLRNQARVIV